MTALRRALTVVALFVTAGALSECSRLVDPKLPPGTSPFSAPVVYARWWAMTQACSGASGSLAAVSWFETTDTLKDPRSGVVIDGYWSAATNQIVLSASMKLDGGTVRHEMLHALLREGGHSRAQFLGRCAGVVSCTSACVDDAGPPPPIDPGAIEVLPESITVGITVDPAEPSAAHDDGFFTITVTARNPASHPVMVLFPLPARPARTFGFDLTGPVGRIVDGVIQLDLSVAAFAPNETKQQVFDFVVGQQPLARALSPGNYTVVGSFGGKEAAPISIVLR
jgi:hypothetical protein